MAAPYDQGPPPQYGQGPPQYGGQYGGPQQYGGQYGGPPPQPYGYHPQQQQQQQQTTVVVAGQQSGPTVVSVRNERFADKVCLNLIITFIFPFWLFIWICLCIFET